MIKIVVYILRSLFFSSMGSGNIPDPYESISQRIKLEFRKASGSLLVSLFILLLATVSLVKLFTIFDQWVLTYPEGPNVLLAFYLTTLIAIVGGVTAYWMNANRRTSSGRSLDSEGQEYNENASLDKVREVASSALFGFYSGFRSGLERPKAIYVAQSRPEMK